MRALVCCAVAVLLLGASVHARAETSYPASLLDETVRFGIEMPEGTTMTTQERAYTSPIWYTP